jgi:hypothetical protein
MPVMINVHGDLARRLKTEAELRSLSVEDLAITILDHAIPKLPTEEPGDDDWGIHNRRRFELIQKSTRNELTIQEQAELDELQSSLDERFESFDVGILARLDEMKRSVAAASAGQPHD